MRSSSLTSKTDDAFSQRARASEETSDPPRRLHPPCWRRGISKRGAAVKCKPGQRSFLLTFLNSLLCPLEVKLNTRSEPFTHRLHQDRFPAHDFPRLGVGVGE